jgi:hypothetical protein
MIMPTSRILCPTHPALCPIHARPSRMSGSAQLDARTRRMGGRAQTFLALALLTLTSLPARAADLKTVLAGPRLAAQTADYRAVGHLVRVDAAGKRTSRDITIKAHGFPGVVRILVEITGPADARARILLDMHPGGQSSIRIAHPGDKSFAAVPFDQWSEGPVGPGFSYEDLLQQYYFWSGQAVLESVTRGARLCDVLKSTPGPADKSTYAEVRTWLDHTIDFPIYAEKTLKSGAVKEYTSFDLRHDGGVWSATQIEEETRGQAGSTLLIINRGSPKANLTAQDFSPEKLVHF